MFRSPQAGDWADEDDVPPITAPSTASGAPARSAWGSPDTNAPAQASTSKETNAGNKEERRSDNNRSTSNYDSSGRAGYLRAENYPPLGSAQQQQQQQRSSRGSRWDRDTSRDYDSRNDYRGGRDYRRGGGERAAPALPIERGIVVSMKESFGFVSCVDREGDLFFHITEAPADTEVNDEVEFKVKYNQRSQKDIACQLVRLPKGTIVMEDISEDFIEGIVSKGLPRGSSSYSSGDARYQREEVHGLIEVTTPQEAKDDKEQSAEADADDEPRVSTIPKREYIRFNSESILVNASGKELSEQNKSNKSRSLIPSYGDTVRFRIAHHRKTGVKRAVELTITSSAKEKLEQEIAKKLETMVREHGVVDRIKSSGGFIRCCDRPEDVYFPFHEIQESNDDANSGISGEEEKPTAGEEESKNKEQSSRKGGASRNARISTIREGDEVSFYVYEDQDDDSGRSRPRLTALRVQKLPPGSVSFEKLIQADVEGVVSKCPKEPRNGAEVIGSITITAANNDDGDTEKSKVSNNGEKDLASDSNTGQPVSDSPNTKKSVKETKKSKKKVTVAFRLSDTQDMSYVPLVGDTVNFDQVLEKRTGKVKAINVRVVKLNPKKRETGVITSMKEDFGFIKCAERATDAYFRFSDVMSAHRDFRIGTEVAFDVNADPSKSDNVRASRVELLPEGTVQWEDQVERELVGEVIALPSRRQNMSSNRSNKPLQKVQNGRIRFVIPGHKLLADYFPDIKQQIDKLFVGSSDKVTTENEEKEIRLAFPSSMSKFERAVVHEYSEWLGIKHESSGDGSNRQLQLVADKKIPAKKTDESPPEVVAEFKLEDVSDVRYDPRLGDRVKFNLVLVKRTKQFFCKSVLCVEAAPRNDPTSGKTKGVKGNQSVAASVEGFIVSIKSEGFGFIQPASTIKGGEENVFFHVKEITTGESHSDLKEGMEVRYTVSYDEKKKKTRAVDIVVLPSGTIQPVTIPTLKGVVVRPSLLHRMKTAKGAGRFSSKQNKQISTIGKIRVLTTNNDGESEDVVEESGVEEDEDEDQDEKEEEDAEDEATEQSTTPSANAKESDVAKNAAKKLYSYHLTDIMDPTVILREGDEVEFAAHATTKGMRAAKIRLLVSHAKEGVVMRVTEDFGGIICLDDKDNIKARFTARNVLRGDLLKEGDRVQFAYSIPKTSTESSNNLKSTPDSAVDEEQPVGVATSVLRLSSGSTTTEDSSVRRSGRAVNSTLREAMRQIGANAMVATRMAKGPDGTRGFVAGWRVLTANSETQ